MSADLIELIKVLQLRAEQCDRGNWYVSLSEMHTILDALASKDATLSEMRAELDLIKALKIRALWNGDSTILWPGAEVTILAIDHEDPSHRKACWVRYWPANSDFPAYRSCDVSDLDMDEKDAARAASQNEGEER